MSTLLPMRARRLFAHYDAAAVAETTHRDLLFARLLEEGDSHDLIWLTSVCEENELATWFSTHGERLLSRRSRAFWRWLLVSDLDDSTLQESELWPL